MQIILAGLKSYQVLALTRSSPVCLLARTRAFYLNHSCSLLLHVLRPPLQQPHLFPAPLWLGAVCRLGKFSGL